MTWGLCDDFEILFIFVRCSVFTVRRHSDGDKPLSVTSAFFGTATCDCFESESVSADKALFHLAGVVHVAVGLDSSQRSLNMIKQIFINKLPLMSD